MLSLSKGPSQEGWFDKPVLSVAEGLTTNGKRYNPFALSLSKGPCAGGWFDKLTTNGIRYNPFALSLPKGPRAGGWFDKPVLSVAEGLTTNGKRYW